MNTPETSYIPVIALGFSIFAIAFTIFNFWWSNTRRGKLDAIGPQYVFGTYINEKIEIKLPLVFQNTGSQAVVISGFRVRFLGSKKEDLLWMGFSSDPSQGISELKKPLVVKKFDAIDKILCFQRENHENLTELEEVQLEAIWSGEKSWRVLSVFKMPSPNDGWIETPQGIDIIAGVDRTGESNK